MDHVNSYTVAVGGGGVININGFDLIVFQDLVRSTAMIYFVMRHEHDRKVRWGGWGCLLAAMHCQVSGRSYYYTRSVPMFCCARL